MTPEAQQRAIAIACGKRPPCEGEHEAYPTNQIQGVQLYGCRNCSSYRTSLCTKWSDDDEQSPNYLRDLNAMHEAEKMLTIHQGAEFRLRLAANSDGVKAQFPTVEAAMCHATSSQRAEAFLKTIGKWEKPRKDDDK